jgi:hypothetical protein
VWVGSLWGFTFLFKNHNQRWDKSIWEIIRHAEVNPLRSLSLNAICIEIAIKTIQILVPALVQVHVRVNLKPSFFWKF